MLRIIAIIESVMLMPHSTYIAVFMCLTLSGVYDILYAGEGVPLPLEFTRLAFLSRAELLSRDL